MKGSSNDAQVKHVFIRGTFNRASPGNVTVTVSSFTCIFAVPGQVRELHSQNLHVIFGLYADGCSWRGSASLGWQFLVAVGSSRTMPYCNLELLGQFVTKQVEAGCSIAPRANFSSHTNGLQQERPISGKKCSFLHLGIEATRWGDFQERYLNNHNGKQQSRVNLSVIQ